MTDTALFYVAAAIAPVAAGGIADQEWDEDVEITDLDVSADFNDLDNITYALAPGSDALPAGLSLSGAGLITGTPTTPAAAVTIIVRGTNSYGTADSAFDVTITEAAYDPVAALFGSGENGFLFDLNTVGDGYLYQDSAKTTLCTTAGDPVGAIADRSGNGNDFVQSVNTNFRPTVASGGGVVFDGIDSYLSQVIDLTGSANLTLIALVSVDTAHSGLGYYLNQQNTDAGGFRMTYNESNSTFATDPRPTGSSGDNLTSAGTYAPPQTEKMVTLVVDETAGTYVLRLDGVQVDSGTETITGESYSNAAVVLGARSTIASFFKGTIHKLCIRAAETSGTALTDAEAHF